MNPLATIVEPDLSSKDFYSNPYPVYHYLRSHDPVHWSAQWGGWLITTYKDVSAVLHDAEHFSNVGRMSKFLNQLPKEVRKELKPFEDHFQRGLINSDPPDHTRIRGLLSKAFTPRLIESQRSRVQLLVNDLLDSVAGNGSMDVIADLAFLLPTTVIGDMLGIPRRDRAQFKKWADDINAFVGTGSAVSQSAGQAQKSLLELREYFRGLIALRRSYPQADLITALAGAEDQGTLFNDGEFLSVCVTLLLAGYETTMSFIGNATLALLNNPTQLEKLIQEPSLFPNAIEELLRFDGPIHRQWRVAAADIELSGKHIAKGQLVGAMLGAANRDPEQFPDPDRLDISRQNIRHVAFGFGIHFCLGAPLARLEGEIALRTLVSRFPRMHLATEKRLWRQEITIHGLKSLPVVFN
jgi:pimeloyl-[acyl-carrier protein] synthase